VKDLKALLAEFNANELHKESSEFDVEQHDGVAWQVFYVVAPDGLCYWFGERRGD
jgi:lactoylglutathione lyase